MKKIWSILFACSLVWSTIPSIQIQAQENDDKDDTKIVIVHSNDAHCQIDRVEDEDPKKTYLGYECFSYVVNDNKAKFKNVTVADAGDHIQGKTVGIFTQGEDIIKIMNEVGYDVATLGNHEFDYGVSQTMKLADLAEYEYVSCNFIDLRTNETMVEPYIIESYETSQGLKKVAYVGVTTPESISKTSPKKFQDEDENFIYGFYRDETGEALYQVIQENVDAARKEGADFVVLVGHLGQNGITKIWRSDTIVQNITGVNAVVDGHSHEAYIQTVQDKEGNDVVIAQTGTLLNAVGVMSIDVETGKVECEIVKAPIPSDPVVAKLVADINEKLKKALAQTAAVSDFDLYAYQEDGVTWQVRTNESNLGDLVTDAFRTELEADIAIAGGGGIRNNLKKGNITYNDVMSVIPFGNDTAVILATGQQILDSLEMGVRKYPEFSGSFMQVSGLTYKIDESIPSSVITDENGQFVKVDGEYRVWGVEVNGEPLDLNKKYKLASTAFDLLDKGDGMAMFEDCEVVIGNGPKDFEVIAAYLQDTLKGQIGKEYENRYGQGRITFETKPEVVEKPKEETPVAEQTRFDSYAGLVVVACIAAFVIFILKACR